MGRGHLGRFLRFKDVQITAIAEVEPTRRKNAQKRTNDYYAKNRKKGGYKGCDVTTDFRKLLERKDIDAVVIATPDHWHVCQAAMAARHGKDIYCEKPLTHSILEGRKLVNLVRKHKIVFQTGSQQRSEFRGRFRRAVELVRNGYLGKIKTVRIGVGPPPVPCDLPTQEVPAGLDWNMWVGPAPLRGYNEILCPKGMHRHFPAFRKYREFAGGSLADMGAHHFDIAQWALAMDNSGPVLVEPPKTGNTGLKFTYANGVVMYHGGPTDCLFEGEKGKLFVSRGKIRTDPGDILKTKIGKDEFHVQPSNNHGRNWIDSVKSRKMPICDVEIGHRSASICHLANLGYRLRRTLKWDPKREVFANDEEANGLRFREPRKPWTI